MKQENNIYVCPETKNRLHCIADQITESEVISGKLVTDSGRRYYVTDGIPDFTFPKQLRAEERETLNYYEGVANIYDDVAHLTFDIQCVDETEARKGFVKLLNLTPNARVLELACGTGRDSEFVAAELDNTGQFYLQDLSRSMLLHCRQKLENVAVPVEFLVGNAGYLPFPNDYFDAVFSFGGLGVFADIQQSLKEMVRVAKTGAKVVVGDESMAPWLYDTEYGRILLNNNALFRNELPLAYIPVEARDLTVRWVIGGVYYLIDFVVGEGEPKANFDIEIPGKRGGTLHTRYYGQLEGVTPETYQLAYQAQEQSGKSMHRWLDDAVRQAAASALGIT